MIRTTPTAIHRAVALLALTLAGSVHAQSSPEAPAKPGTESLETVVVTGSRLRRDINAQAPAPISVVTAETLRNAGNTDITATLREVPALISSGTVADSLERGGGGVGQAVLNLRQLGSNRTLVLVDGRRHVSGVAGSAAVDVATIPSALIERIEVLTGGASAVYGADAVTGVVNYVLKKNFQGLQFDAQTGMSAKGDGRADNLGATWGTNFANGRGNVAFTAGYTKEQEVLQGDRSITRDNGRANNSTTYQNPDRRFQKGDIVTATMPNFGNYYRVGGPGPTGSQIAFGPQIPTAAKFATLFPGKTPTAAEQALIDRAANAPLLAIARQPVFAISSNSGLVFRNDFGLFNADINRNGINDCNESYVGWTGFGGGGCYTTTAQGGVRIFNDGVISTSQNQFGGDGAVERTNASSLTPGSQRLNLGSNGRFELSSAAELYWDAKLVRTNTVSRNSYNTFFDTAFIAPDNPYIPAALQADATDAGGLLVSRDNTDFGPGISRAKRDTLRLVGGSRGEVNSTLSYDFNLNYGRTQIQNTFSNAVLADRFIAATDAVRKADGSIVCRSDLDPKALATPVNYPTIQAGYFTFRPGDGQCKPANLLRGVNSVSPEAVAFFTRPSTDKFRLEQAVATLSFSGDTDKLFKLPGGPISYGFGAEYRKEKSRSTSSDESLGILADGSNISAVSSNVNLLLTDQVPVFNSGGQFDVKEVFGELRLPILKNAPFAHELSVEAAARSSHYSTIGKASTWNLATTWAPVSDLRLRGSYSKAIRAPDIFELFSPLQASTFRPSDPCNIADLDARIAAGLPNAANRKANCAAALTALGVNPNTYADPLTARFAGTSGGNPNLKQEAATTWTAGFVLRPRVAPGLTLSVDYYTIKIEGAIAAVTAQNIVDSCYDLGTYPNQFCGLFDRRADGGFKSLRQVQLNSGRIETAGIDVSLGYDFAVATHRFNARLNVNQTNKLNRFFDPVRTDLVNPGLGELGAPKRAGTVSFGWAHGDFGLTWRGQYIGSQAVAGAVQIEDVATQFGAAGIAKAMWVQNLSGTYELREGIQAYAGVSNLTNEQPYIASSAYPVSGIGRSFFLGLRAKF